jgi:type II secretory pathway component GspD/PulD (secretin)
MFKKYLSVLLLALISSGCALHSESEVNHKNGPVLFNNQALKELQHIRPHNIQAEPNEIHIRKVNSRAEDSTRVSIKQENIPLAEAIVKSKQGVNLIAKDEFVDITKRLNVFVDNMNFDDYLKYISSASGYYLEVDGKNVIASSYKSITLNMASISSFQNAHKKIVSGDDLGTEFVSSNTNDKWGEVLELCSSMLETSVKSVNEFQPYCKGVRSLGLISAAGAPEKIDALEDLLTKTDLLAKQMILVDVKWFDISLGKKESLKQTTLAIKNNSSGLASFGTSMKIFEEGMGSSGIKTKDISVGLGFLITPRILGNKLIEIDISPSVSSLKGWRDADVEMSTAELPDLEFSNFATQVITRSDKPVQVGEFSDAEITTLLIQNDKSAGKATLSDLLSEDGNNMRKIVMTVTPKIVSGI